MKMGVKEFRERFSALAEGDRRVLVTKNGRIIGHYAPVAADHSHGFDWERAEQTLGAFRERWKAETPDWQDQLAAIGLDKDGEPTDPCA